ncbi:hypothetical protein AWM70_17715 [Paenibacillus yonginensis]|uniref:Uncharacterized protein n=1 Tax=Paenibacillus yonginensis TaxID=1462996 RepID=A0A1B1N458_9BACL|nr:hypothetical protein [Paenibacillus yonginensis]ANS76192.1 hypothetical protein AWM70_17715 [Paenibacillus yonginensis]
MNKTAARLVVEPLLERSGSTVSLKLKSRFPGGRNVGGKYTMKDHSVTLYLEEIGIQARQIFGTEEYAEDVLKIVAAHELGHAEDAELPLLSEQLDECQSEPEYNRLALRIEENAWDFARRLLTEVDSGLLDTMIYFSLKAYREAVAEGIA